MIKCYAITVLQKDAIEIENDGVPFPSIQKSSSSGASSPKAVGHEQEMETLSEPSVSSQSQAKEPSNASPSSVVRTKALRVAPAKPKSDPQSLAHREPSQIVNKNSSPAHQATIHAQDILSEMSQMRTSDSRAATAPQKQTAKTASLINSKKFPVVTERPLVARNSPVLRISSPVLSSIPSPLASGESEVFGYESPGSVTIDVALSEDQIMANSGQPWKPAALEKSNNKDLLRYSHQHRQYYKVSYICSKLFCLNVSLLLIDKYVFLDLFAW